MPDNLIFSAPGISLLILICLAAVFRHFNRVPVPQPRPALTAVIPRGGCRLTVSGLNEAALTAAIAEFPVRFDGSRLTPIIRNRSALTFEVEFGTGICPADLLMLVSHVQFSGPGRVRQLHLLAAAEATLTPGFGAIGDALDGQAAVIYVPTGSDELDAVHVLTGSGVFRLALTNMRSAPVNNACIPSGLDQIVALPRAAAPSPSATLLA